MKNLLSKLFQKIPAFAFLFLMAFSIGFADEPQSTGLADAPASDPYWWNPCAAKDAAHNFACPYPINFLNIATVCLNDVSYYVCLPAMKAIELNTEVSHWQGDAGTLLGSQQEAMKMGEKYRQEFERVSGELQKYAGSATPLDHALNILDSNSGNNGVFTTTISQTKPDPSAVWCDANYKLHLNAQATKDVDACLLNVYPKLSSTKCPISDDAPNTVQNIQARADCVKNQAGYANALKDVTNEYLKCTWACVKINNIPVAMHTYALNNPTEQYWAMLNTPGIIKSQTFRTGLSAGLQVAQTVDGVVATATTIGNGIATTAATIQNVAGTISNLSQQVQAQMAPKPQPKAKS